ncbi:MAG: RNA methyltransferase [Candidatus Aminicenantales bacterium]
MPTERRIERVRRVLDLRQPDLRVVFESVANVHNASAVLRTCDAAGVLHVHLIGPGEEAFPINTAISTRADKWVELHFHPTLADCLSELRKASFQIAAACLEEGSLPHTDLDYTRPTAIIFGNESEGISREAAEAADIRVKIPMLGMVQSLNLSVSVGIILYEALKQRQAKGLFGRRRLGDEEFDRLYRRWLNPSQSDKTETQGTKAK